MKEAGAIAKQVEIDRVIAKVLPDQNSEQIKKLQAEGKKMPWMEMELMMLQLL